LMPSNPLTNKSKATAVLNKGVFRVISRLI
jgi:hypothetical protein